MRSPHRLTPGAAAALLAILALTVWTATNVRTVLRWWYPVYYRESIVRWSAAHGLDPWLVAAVVRVESNFRPLATSPRGARGLMQLLPETARWVSGRMGEERFFEDLLYDPETNVRLGTWYLADLLREFDGRLPWPWLPTMPAGARSSAGSSSRRGTGAKSASRACPTARRAGSWRGCCVRGGCIDGFTLNRNGWKWR